MVVICVKSVIPGRFTLTDVWAHVFGRLLLFENGSSVPLQNVCDVADAGGVTVEEREVDWPTQIVVLVAAAVTTGSVVTLTG
jgi:hypothetical protein